MNRIEVNLQSKPKIIIKKVGGALHVKSWDRSQIRMDFQDSSDNFEEIDNTISLSAISDCLIRVPDDCQMQIIDVGGDAHITGLEGSLNIQNIGGSLTLKRIQNADIEIVTSNLSARDIGGDLGIQNVRGNASFKNVKGSLKAEDISGNFDIKNGGSLLKANIGGNSNIRSTIHEDGKYEIECAGNANLRFDNSSDFSAQFSSQAHRILINTNETKETISSETHSLSVGEGSGILIVNAGGHINFRAKDEGGFHFGFDMELDDDFELMVDEISDQVSVQMEVQLEALSDQLASLGEQMQVSGDRAIRQAQKKIEQAQKRLEKNIKARGGRHVRKTGMPIAVGNQHNAEPVSEQERMKVLEMVQEKKISVSEAELLLATLEGKTPSKESAKHESVDSNEK